MRVNPHSETPISTGITNRAPVQEPRLEQDKVMLDTSEKLSQALQATPEVRADQVERAKSLLQDASYPPEILVRKLSALLAIHMESQKSTE